MKNSKRGFGIIAEFIGILILFIIVSIFQRPCPLTAGPAVWLILLGVIWFIVTIITLVCNSWTKSMICLALSVILMFTGAFLKSLGPEAPIVSEDEIGICTESEWILRIEYINQYGTKLQKDTKFKGPTKDANIALNKEANEWNNKNPLTPYISCEKLLYWIPKDYAKEHHYYLTSLSERY
jgi:hypothetical protein